MFSTRLSGDESTGESQLPGGEYTGESQLPGGEYTGGQLRVRITPRIFEKI
jgi:hypothetical protein